MMLAAALFLAAQSKTSQTNTNQTKAKRTPEQIQASSTAHHADFDYLLGDWEFTAESQRYGKFRGYWSAVRLDGGQIRTSIESPATMARRST